MIQPPVIHVIGLPLVVRMLPLFGQTVYTEPDVNFCALLRQLAPHIYASLLDRTQRACYVALLEYMSGLFPVDPWASDWVDAAWQQSEEEAWWSAGVPVDWQGCPFMDNDGGNENSPSVCLIGLKGMSLSWIPDGIKPFKSLFDAYAAKTHLMPKPRTLRKLCPPWHGLLDLVNWVNQNTGYGFLDVTPMMLAEAGDDGPPWNAGEIRSIASAWRECRPILERAQALQAYIDAKPKERLPLLMGALTGDEAVLNTLMQQP